MSSADRRATRAQIDPYRSLGPRLDAKIFATYIFEQEENFII